MHKVPVYVPVHMSRVQYIHLYCDLIRCTLENGESVLFHFIKLLMLGGVRIISCFHSLSASHFHINWYPAMLASFEHIQWNLRIPDTDKIGTLSTPDGSFGPLYSISLLEIMHWETENWENRTIGLVPGLSSILRFHCICSSFRIITSEYQRIKSEISLLLIRFSLFSKIECIMTTRMRSQYGRIYRPTYKL